MTPLNLPPSLWESHPNFPHNLLLLGSHRSFRTTSARLVELAHDGADPKTVPLLRLASSASRPTFGGLDDRILSRRHPPSTRAQAPFRVDGGRHRETIRRSFAWWKSSMRGHERYEESKLYPFLLHRWGIDPAAMEAGHEGLAAAEDAVWDASFPQLGEALAHHHQVLLKHLDLEERTVVPALLALSRDEFDQYYDNALPQLVREVPCYANGCAVCNSRSD